MADYGTLYMVVDCVSAPMYAGYSDNSAILRYINAGEIVYCFAALDDSLLALTDGVIIDMTGNSGTPNEAKVKWSATSGMIGYEMIDQKYVSRYNFRIKPETLADVRFEIQYDSDGVWHRQSSSVRQTGG